ncbi:MAG: arylsulfatase [Caldilineaceae bacterium]|nr:arylsulfatase [Caldilineaceae bacterium]
MRKQPHVDGSSLPFPQTPSASIAGRTLAESTHRWRQDPKRLSKDAPNIVIFMSDDAGFSNPDTFGGPVHTPTLTRLAEGGIAYNRFHTTAMCSPTRAALLTGRNHTHVGAGQIAEFANDFDGYVGEIPRSAATVARVLSEYGYNSAAFGKWHNTPPSDVKPGGPYDQYPTGLGFRYFYGFIAGETSQYEPRLFENVNPIEPPHDPAYHLTEDMAERAKTFIRNHLAYTPDDPFFLYFAPGAVHGPHHVPKAWADKYKGKFDEGWEALREETFKRQKELGWIPQDAELTSMDPSMQRWADVPEEQRAFQTRLMEVYAGFLEHTDAQYGKVVDELEAQGLLENTLIIYINSDNGASAEGMNGTISELLAQNSMFSTVEEQLDVLEQDYGGLEAIGGPLLENMYHHGWAWAGDTPFKSTKLIAAHFGGTRTPCVIHWPQGIQADRRPRPQFHHVIDIVPTLYEVAGITPPRSVDGFEQMALDGDSMVYSFNDPEAPEQKRPQFFDIMGSRGIYQNGWFAAAFGPKKPWSTDISGLLNWDPDDDVWELYDLSKDFSQARDLADEMPKKLRAMKAIFTMEATKNQAFPIGGGLYIPGYHPEEMRVTPLNEWNFFAGQTRIGETLAPRFISGFSSLATITADLPENAEGVLFCLGGISAGFTVFMDQGYLHAEYNAMTLNRYKVRSEKPLPTGNVTIEVELKFDSRQRRAGGAITFRVNGEQVGQGRFEDSVPVIFTASETFDVGMDLGSPVALDYYERAPFKFNGKIEKINIKYI